MAIATTLISDIYPENKIIHYKELYPFIIEYLQNFCAFHGFKHNQETRDIIFKETTINYHLFYVSQNRQYFLSFKPKNVWQYSSRRVLIPAFNITIDFFKLLPEIIDIKEHKFTKSHVTGEIDISEWNFTTDPDFGLNKIKQISSLKNIKDLGSYIYSAYSNVINKKLLIIDATDGRYNRHLKDIADRISKLFTMPAQTIYYNNKTLENIEIRTDKSDLFILLFRNGILFNDDDYRKFKRYVISNDIPSQIINITKYKTITEWGFENLLFEILKKIYRKDIISLDTLSYGNIDGFLCLSDVGQNQNNKLFGISISYTGKYTTEDWLEIYNDINYETSAYRIEFDEENINKISDKIQTLTNFKDATIDVYVTKRWKLRNVGHLIKDLSFYNIKVRRFLYVSKKTNRFLINTLQNETLNINPFIIWNGKIASIQTNSKITLYGTMFPLFIELLNPWTSGDLSKEDLELTLWLVKKRIYRIMNFYNLKTPEILSLFEQIQNLQLQNITNKMKINLHILI